MTPRSKRYFAIKRSHKYHDSAIACLMPVFENYKLAMDAMAKLAKPIPRYPRSGHERGYAIVGEVGPELVMRADGSTFMTYSRLLELPTGTVIIPESARIYPDPKSFTGELGPDIVREGLYDVTVKNAFTPFAHTTIKKITK